jgi:kynurenine formamidase
MIITVILKQLMLMILKKTLKYPNGIFIRSFKSLILYFLSCTFATAADFHHTKILDLTYPFDEKTIYWPTERGFQLHKISYGETPKGYFYSAYKFCAPEHGGTHVDAPRHFSKHGWTVDNIPLDAMHGKIVVINVASKVQIDPNYAISMMDIKQFEKQYRNINSQDIVLFYTGWGRHWGNKKNYLGNDTFGDTKDLHFPGISKDAAQYLVDEKVKAIGIDTPSLDPGISSEFWAHRIILGANIYGIENIANLQSVPSIGAELIVAPLKIRGGSGAPARVYALY